MFHNPKCKFPGILGCWNPGTRRPITDGPNPRDGSPQYFLLPGAAAPPITIAQRHPTPTIPGWSQALYSCVVLSVRAPSRPGPKLKQSKPNQTKINSTQLNPKLNKIQTSTKSTPQQNPNLNQIQT